MFSPDEKKAANFLQRDTRTLPRYNTTNDAKASKVGHMGKGLRSVYLVASLWHFLFLVVTGMMSKDVFMDVMGFMKGNIFLCV